MTSRERSLLVAVAATVVALLGAYLGMGAISRAGERGEVQVIEGVATGDGSGPIDHAEAEAVAIEPAPSSASPSADAAGGPAEADAPSDGIVPASTVTSGSAPAPDSADAASPAGPDTPPPSPTRDPTGPSGPTTEGNEQGAEAVAPPSPTTPSTVPSSTTTTSTTTVPGDTEPAPTTEPPAGDAPTDPSTVDADGLDPIEREIYRLTNELRADPDGPLARVKPMPPCVDDPFHAITIDDATGHPSPLAPLELQPAVSSRLSRPWAAEMNERNTLQHRSNGSQMEIYAELGIELAATGENIAWLTGYPDDEAARTHFEGWRESDTGHYCAMLSASYTHVGVGHLKGSTRWWAVQNFYRER